MTSTHVLVPRADLEKIANRDFNCSAHQHGMAAASVAERLLAAAPPPPEDAVERVGALRFIAAVREFSPNGEMTVVRAWPDGSWDVYDPAAEHAPVAVERAALSVLSPREKALEEALRGLFTVCAMSKFERGDERPMLPDHAYDRAMNAARVLLDTKEGNPSAPESPG